MSCDYTTRKFNIIIFEQPKVLTEQQQQKSYMYSIRITEFNRERERENLLNKCWPHTS